MMAYLVAAVTAVLLIAGAFFALAAATGLVRLPDLYTRMHSASKAGTVGSGLLLFAAGLYSQDPAVIARALAGFVFFLLTAPVSAHLLARAAHHSGHDLGAISVRDDMRKR
ncbi:multicomponent Na+:H+ antiporter subunit G [Rhizobium binae]|uniref:Multicomponent Na+:H+ antiporter subunit G n=1 Tax=Rhizobium binae TaxID=1138190 RepID=A0ABV2MDD2_9HYPH|nr:monovalent cation/H(+) antiporter subunit G [Rhizobium binae]MBX4993631.1 monovalent cation/H(+) antiporter subunit G [Rhizobium binae]NKL46682.1 Na+/H+ antiporter subunit G [Rhizobium leguminosarum bv. viciae]QSY83475.1 monovalent cation/H(+) antiporter subunit G [Rhizobium binae]